MPRVVNSRLDVAQSDLKAAGINEDAVEILGGGAFGVIDESNWNVCAQEPEPGEAITGKVRLTVDRSCDTEEVCTNARFVKIFSWDIRKKIWWLEGFIRIFYKLHKLH